jgi:hypothetical protein
MTRPSDTSGGETHGGRECCLLLLAQEYLEHSQDALSVGNLREAMRLAEGAFLITRVDCARHTAAGTRYRRDVDRSD